MDQSQAEQPEKANVGVDRGMDRSVKKNAKRILVGARKTGGYVALLFSGVWCLAGCSNLSGQPKALDTIYDAYEQNRVAHYKEVISRLDLSAAAASQSTRNEVMNDLILIVDQNYYRIEKSLYGHKAWADFGGSVLATGLGTAGTLSGANGVKTTLSALVTAIDSTKTSFNKDILQGQTMIAITAQMRKLRAEKMLEIRQSMKESIGDYPLSQGINDLMNYYNAGTFIAALQSLTEDAAAGKKKAEDQTKAEKFSANYQEDDASAALQSFWKPNGVVNKEHMATLNKWLKAKGIKVSIPTFISTDTFAAERKQAVAELITE